MLSKESNKYIKRAILGSGTVANVWGLTDHIDHSEYMYTVAAELDEPKTSTIGLIKFLKNAPAKKLIGFGTREVSFYNTLNFPFAPTIES